jgi:hypothetical protein
MDQRLSSVKASNGTIDKVMIATGVVFIVASAILLKRC